VSEPTPPPNPLLSALRDDSPSVVAGALRKVRFRDIKDPDVLAAVLRSCADERQVPGATVEAADPFAAFFSTPEGGAVPGGAGRAGATLAVIAAERLEKAGLPETTESAAQLAAVLDALPTAGALGPVAARLLAETRWPDATEAVRHIVPALCRHDVPLFQVLVKLPSTVLDTVCALAASPFRPRLFQELMNHSPSQDTAVAAVVAAVGAGTAGLDEVRAVTLVSTLVAWNRKEAAEVAALLEPSWPLLLAWRALDDASQRPALRERLERGELGDPGRFWPRVAEVLRHRETLPGYPVATFLRLTAEDPGVVAAVGVDDEVAAVLHTWVADLSEEGSPERVDRAWGAAVLLLGAERLDASRVHLERALQGGDPARWPAFDAPVLTALARAVPPLSGLVDLLATGVGSDPAVTSAVVEALAHLDDGAVARVVDRVLGLAESAPRVVERLSPKVVREAASGVDVDALEPLIGRCHAHTRDRFERARAVLRAG
jgi:hypothetical protein